MITVDIDGRKVRPIGLHCLDADRYRVCGVQRSSAEIIVFPAKRQVGAENHSEIRRGTVIEVAFRSRNTQHTKQSA